MATADYSRQATACAIRPGVKKSRKVMPLRLFQKPPDPVPLQAKITENLATTTATWTVLGLLTAISVGVWRVAVEVPRLVDRVEKTETRVEAVDTFSRVKNALQDTQLMQLDHRLDRMEEPKQSN